LVPERSQVVNFASVLQQKTSSQVQGMLYRLLDVLVYLCCRHMQICKAAFQLHTHGKVMKPLLVLYSVHNGQLHMQMKRCTIGSYTVHV